MEKDVFFGSAVLTKGFHGSVSRCCILFFLEDLSAAKQLIFAHADDVFCCLLRYAVFRSTAGSLVSLESFGVFGFE